MVCPPALFFAVQGAFFRGRGGSRTFFFVIHRKQDQQGYDAHADGAVRHVERRPVIASHVKVEKVHDFTILQPVEQIPDRSSENAGDAQLAAHVRRVHSIKDRPQQTQGEDGRPHEEDEPERTVGRGKHAEGRAGVPNIGQVEKPGDDGDRFMQVHGMHDEGLGDLIQDHDDETHAKQDAPPLESVVHATASMHRSQSVG